MIDHDVAKKGTKSSKSIELMAAAEQPSAALQPIASVLVQS